MCPTGIGSLTGIKPKSSRLHTAVPPIVVPGFVGTALIAQALVACGVGSTTTESIRNTFPALQARHHDTKCRSLGFNPGTEGYKQCRLRLKIQGSHEPLL